MNTFILLGPPGAGKGTQADLISADLGIPKISTGDMLRSAVTSKSDLGNRVEDILNSGKLVSDDIIIELINDRINQSCLLYTSPSPRDLLGSRMPSSA